MTNALRNAITHSGLSLRELERATGVKRQSIVRFVRAEQTLRLDMADRLAVYFGLKLVGPDKARRKEK